MHKLSPMKITLFLITIFSAISACADTTVYLCDSTTGKKYHLKSNCRGLSNCQHKIINVTLSQAKKQGKTLCKWED